MGLRGSLAIKQGGGVEVIDERTGRPIPTPPDNLSDNLLREWEEYWTSEVANASDAVDVPTVRRLFIYRLEWETLSAAYMALPVEERVIEGSRNSGAIQIHPFSKRLTELEKTINMLEKELGLTPLARARLGIEIGQSKRTWQQVNAHERKERVGISGPSDMMSLPVSGIGE